MTVDQFVERIGDLGTQIDRITDRALAVAGPIVAEVKAAAPSKTGALKSSIGVAVESGSARAIYFTMKNYGYFQNYGVQASPDSKTAKNFNQRPVEEQVRFALPPRSGDKFKFGIRTTGSKPWGAFYSGLNAVGFFSMAEIQRRLVDGLNSDVNEIARTI